MNDLSHNLAEKKGRIESLDFLRGIAACAVMLFHYTAETSIDLSNENPLRLIGVYGHFGVQIFFIVSGIVIPYSMYASAYKVNNIKKFLWRRTIRIEIPFLVMIVMEVLLIYVSSLTPWKTGVSDRLDVFNILLHIGYLNDILGVPWLIPIFWTLAIEFQFYLLIAVIFPLLSQNKLIYRASVILILVLLSFILPQPYLFFKNGLFFLSGVIIFQVQVGIIERREFAILSAALLLLIYVQEGPISLFVSATTMMIILFFKCNWKWSGFLGMISYSIYLVHVPFGGRLLLLTNTYIHSELIRSMLIIGFLVSTIFVAWIFYLVVEKPSLFLSKRFTYKDSP